MTEYSHHPQRPPIPQKWKDVVAEINRGEDTLDHTVGEYGLYRHVKALKASIPPEYKIYRDYRSIRGRWKIDYA